MNNKLSDWIWRHREGLLVITGLCAAVNLFAAIVYASGHDWFKAAVSGALTIVGCIIVKVFFSWEDRERGQG